MHSRPMVVVQTWFTEDPLGGCYLVELADPERPRAPRLELVTYDRGVYEVALYGENWPQRFVATYHAAGLRLVLDDLVPVASTEP